MAFGLFKKRNREINKIVSLPVSQITPNPNTLRTHQDQDALQELCRSIITNGLLQPVTVRKNESGTYELLAGERRWRAFQILDRETIPAVVEQYSLEQMAVFSLVENMQRKSLHYFDEAAAMLLLMEEYGLNQQQLCQKIGMSQSVVSNKMRLLKIAEHLREDMIRHNLTEAHAMSVIRLDDATHQEKAVSHIIANNLSVDQTVRYVDGLIDEIENPKRPKLFVVKDMRIFLNSINKAVDMMVSAGIPVESTKTEEEDYLELVLRIPKSDVLHTVEKKAL